MQWHAKRYLAGGGIAGLLLISTAIGRWDQDPHRIPGKTDTEQPYVDNRPLQIVPDTITQAKAHNTTYNPTMGSDTAYAIPHGGVEYTADSFGLYTVILPSDWNQTVPSYGMTEADAGNSAGVLAIDVYDKIPVSETSPQVVVTISNSNADLAEFDKFIQNEIQVAPSHLQNYSHMPVAITGAQFALKERYDLSNLNQHGIAINAYGLTHSYNISGTWTDTNDGPLVENIVDSLIVTDH